MKRLFPIFFAIFMLGVFVTNSILEIGLANKSWGMELSEKSEKDGEEKETDDNEGKDNEKEEKEPKTDDKNLVFRNQNLVIFTFDDAAELKAGLTHLYADNLRQVSRTLETPPPEVTCI